MTGYAHFSLCEVRLTSASRPLGVEGRWSRKLWELGRRCVDGAEEGDEVLPNGGVHDEMVPRAAEGIL